MEVRTDSFKKMVCVEGKDLVSASDQAVRHAFKRSPLLNELADEIIPLQMNSICSTLGVVVPSFHKWLAVACGAVCSTADIVDVLRIAIFLQDEEAIAACSTLWIELLLQSPRLYKVQHVYWTPKRMADSEEVADELCRIGMRPNEAFVALRHIPLAAVAHMRPSLLVDALVARISTNVGDAPVRPACPEQSCCGVPPGGVLCLRGTACCEAANILFHAPHIPAGMLRTLCVHPTTRSSDDPAHIAERSLQDPACGMHGFHTEPCRSLARALAAALRTHAASLQHLTLCGHALCGNHLVTWSRPYEPPRGLDCPAQQLRTLRILGPLRSGRSLMHLLRSCPHLTKLSISGWDLRHIGDNHDDLPRQLLRDLESLHLSGAGGGREAFAEFIRELFLSPKLRELRVDNTAFVNQLFEQAAAGRRCLSALECVCLRGGRGAARAHAAAATHGRLPLGWLSLAPRLREVEIACAGWYVDLKALAGAVRPLPLLTRLTVARVSARAALMPPFVSTLARAPRLRSLCMHGICWENVEPYAHSRGDPPVSQVVSAAQHNLTDAQRQWLAIWEPWSPRSPDKDDVHTTSFAALTSLDLSANAGMDPKLIHCCVSAMPNLVEIDLGGNDLGAGLRAARSTAAGTADSTFCQMSSALAWLSGLRRLGTAWTGINDEDALRILHAVRGLQALEFVDLRYNDLSIPGGRYLLRDLLMEWASDRPQPQHSTQHGHAEDVARPRELSCIVEVSGMMDELFA